MEKQLITRLHKRFEEFAHELNGVEFWHARDLQQLLGYDNWQNFEVIVKKAKTACSTSGAKTVDHFTDVSKMVDLGSGARRNVPDIVLTRYACYLIAQNGDPRKSEIAFAQTYFAVQTRRMEVVEKRLNDIERLHAREKLSVSEKELSGVVYERGVDGQGFARLRSKGDEALFGGHSTQVMKRRLGVPDRRALADFLPAVTITAKELVNQMTSHNVRRDGSLRGEAPITNEHVRNNKYTRKILGHAGIIPEDLPPEEDTKKLGRKLKIGTKRPTRGKKR